VKNKQLKKALIWIVVYVVAASLADGLSSQLGLEKSVTAAVLAVLSIAACIQLKKEGSALFYGLKMPVQSWGRLLYCLPFVLLATVNFWFGCELQTGAVEAVLYVISMIFVAFLEELIFRGFLFRAIQPEGVKAAVIIASVTFGLGHIINLLNGAELLPTLLQLVYATAVGFAFTVFVLKTGSLIPCIICHAIVNASSVFGVEPDSLGQLLSCLGMSLVAILYTLWLLKLPGEEGTQRS